MVNVIAVTYGGDGWCGGRLLKVPKVTAQNLAKAKDEHLGWMGRSGAMFLPSRPESVLMEWKNGRIIFVATTVPGWEIFATAKMKKLVRERGY